jgi:nucleoside-diphosphate-sugar epimerase
MKSKIFVTGITGCVGHYLFDLLVSNPDHHLYLLVRDPAKMKADLSACANVTVIKDDLSNIEKYAEILKEMDYVVHIAAGWGGTEINYEYTIALFNLLDAKRCKKIIYFSTASILGPDNRVMEKVGEIGTSYIQGKYRCYKALPQLKVYDRIITLFPTWVLGGDSRHPYSHATAGILGAIKWLWLIRFFTFDISFHFIHARDIALIVDHFLKNEVKEKEFVLGNRLITADRLIEEICVYFHKPLYFRLSISPAFVEWVASVFGKGLSLWDKYSLERRSFEYKVVNARTFGIPSQHETVSDILRDLAAGQI